MLKKIKIMLDKITEPVCEFVMPLDLRLGWSVLVVAGLLCIFTLGEMIWNWRSDWLISHPDQTHVKFLTDETSLQIAHIPDQHLFGQFGVANQSAVPITSLQLRLIGIIQAIPEEFSKVIISEAGQPGKIYSIGDSFLPGIKVSAITTDGVVLENNGRLEKLLLQRSKLSFKEREKF